ncbi:MAG: carboxylesterase family protein, partial [Thermoleophilia bacterium]|nr:carboxylesterase family protein [Thermoleophilia bacterium]
IILFIDEIHNLVGAGAAEGAIDAASILDLLVSPLAEGLFQRAIVQSAILLDKGFGVTTTGTLAEAEREGVALAEKLGIKEGQADAAAALRAKSPEELLAAAGASGSVMEEGLRWKPVVDGYVLPDSPTALWAAGKQHPVALLIGSNRDEGNLFVQGLNVSPTVYEEQMRKIFGPYADQVLALYPAKTAAEVKDSFSRMLTEMGFASTARFAARMMSGVAQGAGGTQGTGATQGT